MSYYSYNNRGGGFLSSIPTATKNIIIINVLVMIMTSLNGDLMYQKFALFYPTSPFFRWWQPACTTGLSRCIPYSCRSWDMSRCIRRWRWREPVRSAQLSRCGSRQGKSGTAGCAL